MAPGRNLALAIRKNKKAADEQDPWVIVHPLLVTQDKTAKKRDVLQRLLCGRRDLNPFPNPRNAIKWRKTVSTNLGVPKGVP